MEIKASHLDGVRFELESRGHKILCDQPAEDGGQNTGMSPPELLLASLGSCAAFYAARYLSTRNFAQDGLAVTITAEKFKQPARLGNFHIKVQCPVELTPEQNEALLRSVRHCTIHNTLLSPPRIEVELSLPSNLSS